MRHLVLLAVLASACDQGATAATPTSVPTPALQPKQQTPTGPPAYVVRDNADFAAKGMVLINALFAIFEHQTHDCELLATRVESFGGEHKTMFAALTAYGRAHPEAEKALQAEFGPHVDQLVQKITPALSRCMSNQRLMTAFQALADDTQQLQQHRPR